MLTAAGLTGALQLGQDLSSFKLVADHLQVGFDAADEAGALEDKQEVMSATAGPDRSSVEAVRGGPASSMQLSII